MDTSEGEINQQQNEKGGPNSTVITNANTENIEEPQQLGDKSNISGLGMKVSKSKSSVNGKDKGNLSESGIKTEKDEQDDSTLAKKSTKKEKSLTIECLNLVTKPRFQKMTTEIFKTFLSRKSEALALEKVALEQETSAMLELKYPMLKAPKVQQEEGKNVTSKQKVGKTFEDNSRSTTKGHKIQNIPPKKADSSKTIEEKHSKIAFVTTTFKAASNTQQDDGEIISMKMPLDSGMQHTLHSKKEKKEKKLVSSTSDLSSSSPVHPSDEKNKPLEGNIKKNKTRKVQKETHLSKSRKLPDKFTQDENDSSDETVKSETVLGLKSVSAVDETLGIVDSTDWWVDDITLGEIIGDADNDDIILFNMVSETMSSVQNCESGKDDLENGNINMEYYSGEERNDMNEVGHATADDSRNRPMNQGMSKDSSTKVPTAFAKSNRSSSFITKTKDRMFKDFLRSEVLAKEDTAEKRRSFFDYPSLMGVNDEGMRLKSIDTNYTGSLTFKAKEESSKEILPTVSTTTARLVSMYEANVEQQGSGKWSVKGQTSRTAFKDMKTVIDQGTLRNLDVLTELLGTLKDGMVVEEKGKSCQCKFSRCSMDEERDKQNRILLPNQFTHDDFMRYFCEDWAQPETPITRLEKDRSMKGVSPRPSSIVDEESNFGEDGRSRFSVILDKIDDDEVYDLIFTYKLPKTALFDLKDSINETRLKCIRKWLEQTGNALYRSAFEDEVKAKAEEKINDLLMEKMISLQRKIKRCDVCNKTPSNPSVVTHDTSVSTFSIQDEAKDPVSYTGVDPSTNAFFGEEITTEIDENTDLQIEREMEVLTRKLKQSIVSFEDGDILEKSSPAINESGEQQDENVDEPLSSRRVVMETRGTRRRREIRELLEKLIELLETKLAHMKTRKMVIYKGEDEEGEVVTFEKELSFKSCHCHALKEEAPISEPSVDPINAILRNFPINISRFLRKRSTSRKPKIKTKTRKHGVAKFTKRNRMQLYLLSYLKTWKTKKRHRYEPSEENVEEKRLVDKMEEVRKHKKEKTRAPIIKNSGVKKEIPKTTAREKRIPQKNMASADEPKNTGIPFTCSCFCDKISRFNPKRNQHFRTVLNEHFWCLRTDARLLDDEHDLKKISADLPPHFSLCPPKETEQPDNFHGWLADTDRNLLLLMSRPPMDRIDKDYYKKTVTEKKVQQSLHEEAPDEQVLREKQLLELVGQLSKAQAERFWTTVDRWYEDYKKSDKVRLMLELFQDVDLNAMLQRDLEMMKDELAEQLKITKEQLKIKIEQEKKQKFENDKKKLLAAYSCRLRNRLEAKEQEMRSKKEFLVRCMHVEARENFAPVIEKYKKKCIEWIENLRDKQNTTSLTVNQRKARELALIADKCDVGERVRRKLLGATGKEHEEVEKVLGKAIESRDIVIEGLKSNVINLTRDVNIWKRAVGEVLKSFKKFVHYILETRPSRAQYVLSLEKLYQLQMDDLIRNANNELETDETNEIKPTDRPSETLQPTMEIKCPSHDIRYPSEHSTKTGSSSDTDIEKDIKARKVVYHAVDAAIRAVLPTPEVSVGAESEEDELKELEQLISLFELDNSQEIKIDSVSSEAICEDDQIEHERLTRVIGEGASDPCISVEEFTKRRIREMLEIIARKKPLVRDHVHL